MPKKPLQYRSQINVAGVQTTVIETAEEVIKACENPDGHFAKLHVIINNQPSPTWVLPSALLSIQELPA